VHKDIYKYFVWNDLPAVLVENFNKTYTGYYWERWKWHEANAIQVGDFYGKYDDFGGNQELSKEEFINRFGRIRLWLLNAQTGHVDFHGGNY